MSEQTINIDAAAPSGWGSTYGRFCVRASLIVLLLVLLLNAGYVLAGHTLISALYFSDSAIAGQLMSGKTETPLVRYFDAMDKRVLRASAAMIVVATGLLLSKNLLGVLFSVLSFLAGSLVIFLVLDVFPSLVPALHFDLIPYFKYRMDHIPDPQLGILEKPLKRYEILNFRGSNFSPLYGIEEKPRTVLVETDELGFRNETGRTSADIVVLGSSFPGYGDLLKDTYPKQLEEHTGWDVANLALGGWGPVEFVKALERFGLPKKPRAAILMFHTGDVGQHLKTLVTGEEDSNVVNRRRAFGGFFGRWSLVMEQTWNMLASGTWAAVQSRFQQMVGTDAIHPDVAALELPGGRTERLLIRNRHTGMRPEELLASPVWRLFSDILRDFKRICEANQILPVLAYVPWSTEIYSEYSTMESGQNWLEIRDSQIASSGNDEEAAHRIADEVGIELISFRPAFRSAAREGKLLYLRTDAHWNSEGSDLAAQVTAQALQSYLGSRQENFQLAVR